MEAKKITHHGMKNKVPNFNFNNFWNLRIIIFKNSLRNTLKSKFFIITTIIFSFLLITFTIGRMFDVDKFYSPVAAKMTQSTYIIIAAIYLLTFNIVTLIRFFIEEKQNGIFDLELRKGKSPGQIFFQRILANKIISISFILLAIGYYYLVFSFYNDYQGRYFLINILGPGLWYLLVFDFLVSALIILLSFANKVKLASSLASVFGVLILLSGLFAIIVAGNQKINRNVSLTQDGQFSLHYAKKINQVRSQYDGGIIDSMINGTSEKTSFAFLGADKWTTASSNALNDQELSHSLGVNELYNLNSQILFNGLVPDSLELFNSLGVLEKTTTNDLVNRKYTSNQVKDGLTAAQSTYFNHFFASKKALFRDNEKANSYEDWQKTIFNISISSQFLGEELTFKRSTVNEVAALQFLSIAINDVRKNLQTPKEVEEWNKLTPIIEEAFKSTYLFDFFGEGQSYLQSKNIFNLNASKNKDFFGIGSEIFLEDSWTMPLLTTSFLGTKPLTVDENLKGYQTKIFETIKVKPGTRQLMSIMASLISNSLIVSNVTRSNNSEAKISAKDIKKKQNQLFFANVFDWPSSMSTASKANASFLDKTIMSQAFKNAFDATGWENYYVDVEPTDKFSQKSYYAELINEDDLTNPNFDWEKIQTIKASFSPLGATIGIILANLVLFAIAWFIFRKTLIR